MTARAAAPVTPHIGLRAFSPDDAAWLDGWLGVTAAAGGYAGIPIDDGGRWLVARLRAERRLRARIIERDGDGVGIALFALNAPRRGAAVIELVATAPEYARGGAAMRAAALVEDELRAVGVRTVYSPAAAAHGIAMYFWIRLGYHPLLSPAWPCAVDGVAWLERRLD